MDKTYQNKLYQMYNYQLYFFRATGIYNMSKDLKDSSKIKKLAYDLHFGAVIFALGTYNLGLVMGLFEQSTILDKIMNNFYALATLLGSFAKLCFIKKDIYYYQDQVAFLHRESFAPKNSFEEDLFEKHYILNKRIRNWYAWISWSALGCILILHQITDPHDLPLSMYTPIDPNSGKRIFFILYMYSFISVGTMCCVNVAYDSWCTSFLIFVRIQLDILAHRLEGIPTQIVSELAINQELKKCIQHHTDIFKFVETIESGISTPCSIQILTSILVLCCNFYAMSFISIVDDIPTFLKFFLYQLAMLLQIFIICYFSNEITLASLRLPHALYSSKWIAWNKANRKLMLVALLRFQTSIRVRSINSCYPFNLAAFTSIVNSSYSYFALLKQMNSRD